MGCGGASKQKITAPEIERALGTESEPATKGAEDRGTVVPPLPLAVIPRQSHPLPPQQPDLGKSSPSMSEVSSAKPISPQKLGTIENADLRKEVTPPLKAVDVAPPALKTVEAVSSAPWAEVPAVEDATPAIRTELPAPQITDESTLSKPQPTTPAMPQPTTPDKLEYASSEAVPVSSPHPSAPVPTMAAGPDLLQEEALRSFRTSQVSPPSTKPGKIELSPFCSPREAAQPGFVDNLQVKPAEVPPLPKAETLSEEVLESVQGAPFSPPIKEPRKLELTSPKEPPQTFILSENPQSSDVPSAGFPFSDELIAQPQLRNVDVAVAAEQEPLLNAVESGRKTNS